MLRAAKGGRLAYRRLWDLEASRGAHRKVSVQLKEEVPALGPAGDVVEVTAGFARNYLYPQKRAVYAKWRTPPTPRAAPKKEEEDHAKEDATSKSDPRENLPLIMRRLQRTPLGFRRDVKADGTIDQPITVEAICRQTSRYLGIHLPSQLVALEKPITTIGDHKVPLRITLKEKEEPQITVRIRTKAMVARTEESTQ